LQYTDPDFFYETKIIFSNLSDKKISCLFHFSVDSEGIPVKDIKNWKKLLLSLKKVQKIFKIFPFVVSF